MSRGGNDTCGMLWMLEHFGKYGGTMNRALTKADIVEAIYEKTDRNRADVKNTVEILSVFSAWSDEAGHQEG